MYVYPLIIDIKKYMELKRRIGSIVEKFSSTEDFPCNSLQ